jgi:uncharacterized protein YjbI with pentapeptide repeats
MNLAGMDLENADLRATDCRGVNFSNSNCRGIDLRGADIRGAIFRNSNLYGAKLQGVEAAGADFRGCDLRQVNMGGAYVQGALMPAPEKERSPLSEILQEEIKTPEPSQAQERGGREM